nr:hypothetical protein [Tanacetum cinerariifolium]
MENDPLLGAPIPEVTSEQSSSRVSPQSNVQSNHPMTHHNSKWTKDHPLNYIIGPLSRPVSTRLQLHKQAIFCYYDAFLTSVEPKTYKEALTQACWIEAMQEELNEFEPRPNKVMVITLKWIYKVKLDELGGILKNKARLVARGYRQEEGIDFEESFAPVVSLYLNCLSDDLRHLLGHVLMYNIGDRGHNINKWIGLPILGEGVGVCRDTIGDDAVVKIDSTPASLIGFSMLVTNDDTDELSCRPSG